MGAARSELGKLEDRSAGAMHKGGGGGPGARKLAGAREEEDAAGEKLRNPRN